MKLRYTDRAKDDLEIALQWYERQKKGLGLEFLSCVEMAIKSIRINPEIYQVYYSSFHGCVIRRFPYVIFYTIENEGVVVHSVFDSRRNPNVRPN